MRLAGAQHQFIDSEVRGCPRPHTRDRGLLRARHKLHRNLVGNVVLDREHVS
jgi:hypothetical protein